MRNDDGLPTVTPPSACAALPDKHSHASAIEAMRPADKPAGAALGARWLTLMLDEVGYGLMLLDQHAQVLFANHAARADCAAGHPLQLVGHQLHAREPAHWALLQEALDGARRGRRKLLALGDAGQPVSVAVIPLDDAPSRATLLMMGKRQVCEPQAVHGFALCYALTAAETRVLEGLCQGQEPHEVARLHGVSLATVRSQICSLRAKTGAESIRALVRQVSVLPPMVGILRALP
jgi:DNA-binding CsgD family transcriptional regulator